MENEFKITVFKGGPYKVQGTLKIMLPTGEEVEKTNPYLCRCGHSKNKPFCDGTHAKIGFDQD